MISDIKFSIDSTVFSDTLVSSCNVRNVRSKLLSFKYCSTRRTTSADSISMSIRETILFAYELQYDHVTSRISAS
uniref:Uncharacterized protein n=1 Tax=Schistosoma japonicum TaxID=6182 RepID=Q5C2B5_SCHJA|nr:unknown [Schistosoma japonicum]